ncbi:hypothetical protein DPMN_009079 [Dreissena polymorpha]|uniref:Uncharacterized protein n=1 Tax=Dreissena polymorpha TaxID=45954 RepID=A0A9D4RZR0_DREPO|nr:hypothetical protein DPMN_009079 [Dreissena polymorpha]
MSHEHRGGGFGEGPRDSGTQYAQRTGETVSVMKTTAGDDKWGHWPPCTGLFGSK